jgi:hypothetical protein
VDKHFCFLAKQNTTVPLMYVFVTVSSCALLWFLVKMRCNNSLAKKPRRRARDPQAWRKFLIQELQDECVPLQQHCLDVLLSEYGNDSGMEPVNTSSQGLRFASPGISVFLRQEQILEPSNLE